MSKLTDKQESMREALDLRLYESGAYAGEIKDGKIQLDGYFKLEDALYLAEFIKQMECKDGDT